MSQIARLLSLARRQPQPPPAGTKAFSYRIRTTFLVSVKSPARMQWKYIPLDNMPPSVERKTPLAVPAKRLVPITARPRAVEAIQSDLRPLGWQSTREEDAQSHEN
ncbi:MAG: hypothetical protein ABSF91_14755 [Bacteroidota bacterium]